MQYVFKIISKLALLSLCVFFGVVQVSAEDQCELCYSMNSRYCSEQCADKGSACHSQCMSQECDRHCGGDAGGFGSAPGLTPGYNTPGSDTVSNEVSTCKSCVARMKQSGCEADCSNSEKRGQCINRCAKYKCANKCRLPIGNIKRQRRKYQSCSECKDFAKSPCKQKCGTDKTRPGYVACEVSCVETRCLKTCNSQLF